MIDLRRTIAASRRSAWSRFVLNMALSWRVPFNHPHGFKVVAIAGGMRVRIPYWHANRNHLGGLHACALATGAELCSGVALLEHLDPRAQRLIMASLRMDYHKQARRPVHAECLTDGAALARSTAELERDGVARYESRIELHDGTGMHVATGTVTWQLKKWTHVRSA